MGSESKRVMLTLSETSLKRITEIGVEHNIMIESDWGIVTKTIYALVRFISNLDKMPGMDEYKQRTGQTTMDAVRSIVYKEINPESDKKGKARPVPRRGVR